MFEIRKIPVGSEFVEAVAMTLLSKNLVVIRGSKGYVMCGYLDMSVAEKFNDVAVKVTGVATIDDALQSTVHSCSCAARNLGIREGQPVKDILPLIV